MSRIDMSNATCSESGCGKIVLARGLCARHYHQAKKAGFPPLPERVKNRDLQCSVKTCTNPVSSKGLCNGHMHRLRAAGDVQADVPLQKKRRGYTEECSSGGCTEPQIAKGLCKKHYMEERSERLSQERCSVKGCDRPRAWNNGYCVRCYQRWLKHGDPLAGGPMRRLRGTGNRWEYDENRRAAKAKMSQVTGVTKEYVLIIRNDPCAYCGAPSEHIDHLVPFADRPETHWMNLAPACASCNHRKSRMDLLTFLLSRIPTPTQEVASERADGLAGSHAEPLG